jgi:hypothetical protein
MADLPPGFTLDRKPAAGGSALPEGFTLDNNRLSDVSRWKNVPPDQIEAAIAKAKTDRLQGDYEQLPWWKRNLVNIFDAGNFMTRGATAGLIEKGAAAARAPFTGVPYEQELAKQRELTAGSRARQGAGGQALGEIVGGVMAFKGVPRVAGGPVTRAAQGMAEGAGFGGASAYADDKNILQGAGTGAALGAGGSVLIDTIGAAGKPFLNLLKDFSTNPTNRGHMMVLRAIEQAGGKEAVQKAMAELGTPGALVDALGKYGTDLGRAAANISSKARQVAEDFVGGRKAEQNIRLSTAVEQASGLPAGSRKTVEDLVAEAYDKRKPAIDAAYEAARAKGAVLPTESFAEILATPAGKAAVKAAQTTLKNRAPMRGDQAPSMLEILDQAKRELDASATAAYTRGEKQAGETYSGLARTLRERVDAAMQGTDYETARKLRQQAYQEEETLRAGGDLAARNKPLNVTEQVAQVTPENRGALKQGFGAGTVQGLLNQNGTQGVLNNLNTPLAREAAHAVLGNDASILRDQLAREQTMNITNRDLVGNSTTARQLQNVLDFTGSAGMGALAGAGLDFYNRGLSWDTLKSGASGAVLGAGLRYGRGLAERRAMATAPEVMDLLLGKGIPQAPAPAVQGAPWWRPPLTRDDLVHSLIVGGT